MSHAFPSSPDVLLSTAKLESHSATISQIQKGFYSRVHRRGVTPSPRPCSTWIRPKNLSGWQEMWIEFPHQTAGWGMVFVYCEGGSKDVGEEEEGTASFTHECRSGFLREGVWTQKTSVPVCTPEFVRYKLKHSDPERRTVCVLWGCCFFQERSGITFELQDRRETQNKMNKECVRWKGERSKTGHSVIWPMTLY